ncbi:N-acetyltransferase [Afifella marina DSM 2698]|uniref:Acetyltransferase (GNAT) family protein n=2 Tax=Afifella marina TaxID=1080 RepID=A0A1G5N4N4_AFIMA|nr:N-acetyltransferase [Afifella marina DSM 2698]MBK1626925.1 N-acetyltransferase [Afifella marina]MBK5919145.1 hypothetical protein [Afifella marina]RAI20131.1 hypothetical protein CH311_09845 [Afifella marina DSM 2698]SCZ31679.1 Acetyltransferase (GNAT) family protein [Afifella marina DSM 2698]
MLLSLPKLGAWEQKMTVSIRRAEETDTETLLPLFLEMQHHYEGAAAIDAETARPRLLAALKPQPGRAILGAFEDEALGLACLYELFPGPDMHPAWLLKELYVAASARGRRIGEALLREAARLALAEGGARLDLTTAGDNEAAQRFYARVGMTPIAKVYYRSEGAALLDLAEDRG